MQVLDESVAQMIPLQKGDVLGKVQVDLCASEETALEVELRISSKAFNHTPDVVLETKILALHQGKQQLELVFGTVMPEEQYVFLVFKKNPLVQLQYTQERITGILSVFNTVNEAVSNFGKQTPPEDIGIEELNSGVRSGDQRDIISLFEQKKTVMLFLFRILIMVLTVQFNHPMLGWQN